MAVVAQEQYDSWQQDKDGEDVELGRGGFTWKKIPDVKFERNDIVISRLSSDPEEYRNYVDGILRYALY